MGLVLSDGLWHLLAGRFRPDRRRRHGLQDERGRWPHSGMFSRIPPSSSGVPRFSRGVATRGPSAVGDLQISLLSGRFVTHRLLAAARRLVDRGGRHRCSARSISTACHKRANRARGKLREKPPVLRRALVGSVGFCSPDSRKLLEGPDVATSELTVLYDAAKRSGRAFIVQM